MDDGPAGYEPPMIRFSRPGLARWFEPSSPSDISPELMACSEVMSRGCPVASKCAPIAASTFSGSPIADEDETETVAPSGIRAAACSAVMTGG